MSQDAKKTISASLSKQQAGTQIKKVMDKRETIIDLLHKYKSEFSKALPKAGLNTERFTRMACTVVSGSPALQECTPMSIIMSVLQGATMGLEVNTPVGHCYLVPYKGKAALIIGYTGYIELAYRSGKLANINANVVREGDEFEYAYGLNEKLRHVPAQKRGQLTHAYAYFKTTAGASSFIVLTREDIDKHRAMSKAPDGPAWHDNYEAMAQKTAIRMLAKFFPKSAEVQRAMTIDNIADQGKALDIDMLDGEGDFKPMPTDAEVSSNAPPESGPVGLSWTEKIYGAKVQGDMMDIVKGIEEDSTLTPEQQANKLPE